MQEYLDLADIARVWGVHAGTIRRYFHDGRLPEPDAVIGSGEGRRYGWSPETVAAIERVGQGTRTDRR